MSALKPDAVDKHELGTTALPWKNLHIDAVTVGARATGANVPQGTEVTIGSNDKLNNSDPSVPVNVEIYGSLTVHGETTTVTSSNLLVKDKNIILNDGGAAESAAGAGLDFLILKKVGQLLAILELQMTIEQILILRLLTVVS